MKNISNSQIFTPLWLAKEMASYIGTENDVLDPSCGKGVYFTALNSIGFDKAYFGIDIDSEMASNELYNNRNCKISNNDFLKLEIPKYKSIICNPPYIRHHNIDKESKANCANISIKTIGTKLDGRTGYHAYFLIKCLSLLERGGKLAFLVSSDICEGKSSKILWDWISSNFRLDAIVSFDKDAVPFRNVDTNAILILLENSNPKDSYKSATISKIESDMIRGILEGIESDAYTSNSNSIETARHIGFTRLQKERNQSIKLKELATLKRGIATGCNDFFLFDMQKIIRTNIPMKYFDRTISRVKDTNGEILALEDLEMLDKNGRPTYILNLRNYDFSDIHANAYIEYGISQKLNEMPLLSKKRKWYEIEHRNIPAIIFSYLGRKNNRFILNDANAIPTNSFICIYPKQGINIENLLEILNHQETIDNLNLVGKKYGNDAIKVEPNSLLELDIPIHLLELYQINH